MGRPLLWHTTALFEWPQAGSLAMALRMNYNKANSHPVADLFPLGENKETSVSDVLDEAAALVQCRECPWYRSCVMPMRFSAEDIRKQLQATLPGVTGYGGEMAMQNLLASISSAAQNVMLEGCPIFIERLRASPKLAERIKHLMQTWATDEEGKKP